MHQLKNVALALLLINVVTRIDAEVASKRADVDPGSGKLPITTSSDEARQLYTEGRKLLDSFRIEEAYPFFERAVELDPDFVLGWMGLSFSQPRFKEMFELANQAKAMLDRVKVSEGERLQLLGYHASLNADPKTWRDSYARLAEIHPNDERIVYQLGNVHQWNLRDRAGALKLYRRALEIDPGYAPAWNQIGSVQWLENNYDEAEKAYLRTIELAPSDPTTHQSYGDLLLKLGRFDDAMGRYQDALAIRPLFEPAHRGIAAVLLHQDRHDQARERLRALYPKVANDGVRSGIHFALAVTYADEGNFEAALGELEMNYALSEKIHDTFAMALDLTNIAQVLSEAGRHDEAMRARERSLRLIVDAPDQPQQRKDIRRVVYILTEGYTALAKGNLATAKAKAAEYAKKCQRFEISGLERSGHQLAGVIALEEKRWDDALGELLQANTGDAYNMYRMALAFEGKGDHEGYVRMLRYVDEYRGVLNFNYSFVRHKARARLAALN